MTMFALHDFRIVDDNAVRADTIRVGTTHGDVVHSDTSLRLLDRFYGDRFVLALKKITFFQSAGRNPFAGFAILSLTSHPKCMPGYCSSSFLSQAA